MRFVYPVLVVAAATALGSIIASLDAESARDGTPPPSRSLATNVGLAAMARPDRGVTIDSLPRSRESVAATSAPTDVIPELGDGVLPWAEARLEMRADFQLSATHFEDVDQAVRSFSSHAGEFTQLTGRLTVSEDATPEWDDIWRSPTGAKLNELQKQDMTLLVRDAAPALVEASTQAQQLLQLSLYDYWESDRGFKYLESQGYAWPEGFFHPKGGHYNMCFEALAGGWKIAVNFDSSEYELLESQLREAFRQKTELYNALVTVANAR